MFGLSKTFTLDPRLEADTVFIRNLGLSQMRLMNDARWPWIILVPVKHGAQEMHDLNAMQMGLVMQEATEVGKALQSLSGCQKINIAAIGNIVRQLHIHVVARSEGDPNWPKPVWGFEQAVPYGKEEAISFIADIQKELRGKFI